LLPLLMNRTQTLDNQHHPSSFEHSNSTPPIFFLQDLVAPQLLIASPPASSIDGQTGSPARARLGPACLGPGLHWPGDVGWPCHAGPRATL
jgi:hypothetical protein